MAPTTTQFVRADPSNLPNVDTIMLIEYMKSSDKHNEAELRGVKAMMSSRDSYLDSAVGYVELKRESKICIVNARVVPEHRVVAKPYKVSVEIDEENEKVVNATCDDCPASAGGCKHALVLLFWLQKRSSEPSPTSVQLYWTKPALGNIQQEYVVAEEIFPNKKKPQRAPKNPQVLKKFLEACETHVCSQASLLYKYCVPRESQTSFFIFNQLLAFYSGSGNTGYDDFKMHCNGLMTTAIKADIVKRTQSQVESVYWHNIRQGRITASKLYEIARSKTPDGSLVKEILGGYKMIETVAMKRGKQLERRILKSLEISFKTKINQAGFYVHDTIFGASPDGIFENKNYLVEIKCPSKKSTVKNYIKDQKINKKCMAQIQMQMHCANIEKCLFCVADPDYEINQKLKIVFVDYDEKFIVPLLDKAETFYKQNVYPQLIKSVLR